MITPHTCAYCWWYLFFHLNEQSFPTIGWIFDISCFDISCFVVLGSGSVRWKFVHGLFENAIYGGRVDNTFDAKVLQSYLLQYFEQAVFPGQVRWLPQNTFLEIKLVSRYYCALQSLRGQNGRLIAGFRKVPRSRIIRERLPLFVAQCM